MKRHEIIFELAKYAHPSWYHQLLSWQTYNLELLLAYYKKECTGLPMWCGVDLALDSTCNDEAVTMTVSMGTTSEFMVVVDTTMEPGDWELRV